MSKIRVTLHRWSQKLPNLDLDVDAVGGAAPELVRHGGAIYERIPSTVNPPTYSFLRFERQDRP